MKQKSIFVKIQEIVDDDDKMRITLIQIAWTKKIIWTIKKSKIFATTLTEFGIWKMG